MLRKSIIKTLKLSSRVHSVKECDFKCVQLEIGQIYKIHEGILNNMKSRYRFSSTKEKDHKENEAAQTNSDQQQNRTEGIQTIQVSLQEFRNMKQLLQELKSQITNLQQQQQSIKSNNQYNSSNQRRQPNPTLDKKIQQFNKHSQLTQQIQSPVTNYQHNSSLFFKSLQQQLSFQLIKLNAKQQFTELIEHYIHKFKLAQQNIQTNKQELNQLVKLSYLIFYRYTSLQNGSFDDHPIRNLIIKIAQNINVLQESQVQKILSILTDQIKQKQTKFLQQFTPSNKINLALYENYKHFIQELKKILLHQSKIFNFKSKSNQNSQIISLIYHFFDIQELKMSNYRPFLQKKLILQNNENRTIMYNPSNLSHILVNMLRSFGTKDQFVETCYELFQLSLSITQSDFLSQAEEHKNFQFQESLKMKNWNQFQRLQYEGIIYFLQNHPSNQQCFFVKFFNLIFLKDQKIKTFFLLYQLRICLGFLNRPQLLKIDHSYDSKVVQQILNIYLLGQKQDFLLQTSKQIDEMVEINENAQFLHLKKVVMVSSQIGIQLFKNYRLIVKESAAKDISNNLTEIIFSIQKILNKVCIEKVDLRDIFKNEQKQNVSQKLILNLNLFQFIVNLNILSQWGKSLSQNAQTQVSSQQLLTNLVSIFINETKNLLITRHHSEQQKLKLAEQTTIILLIGKQYPTILKSIQNNFQQTQNKQIISNLLKTAIGKNQKHKYFQQYLLLSQCFQF